MNSNNLPILAISKEQYIACFLEKLPLQNIELSKEIIKELHDKGLYKNGALFGIIVNNTSNQNDSVLGFVVKLKLGKDNFDEVLFPYHISIIPELGVLFKDIHYVQDCLYEGRIIPFADKEAILSLKPSLKELKQLLLQIFVNDETLIYCEYITLIARANLDMQISKLCHLILFLFDHDNKLVNEIDRLLHQPKLKYRFFWIKYSTSNDILNLLKSCVLAQKNKSAKKVKTKIINKISAKYTVCVFGDFIDDREKCLSNIKINPDTRASQKIIICDAGGLNKEKVAYELLVSSCGHGVVVNKVNPVIIAKIAICGGDIFVKVTKASKTVETYDSGQELHQLQMLQQYLSDIVKKYATYDSEVVNYIRTYDDFACRMSLEEYLPEISSLIVKDDPKKALEILEKVKSLQVYNSRDYLLKRIECLRRVGNYKEATGTTNLFFEKYEIIMSLLYAKARMLLELEEYQTAFYDTTALLEKESNFEQREVYLYAHILALKGLHKYFEALNEIESVLEISQSMKQKFDHAKIECLIGLARYKDALQYIDLIKYAKSFEIFEMQLKCLVNLSRYQEAEICAMQMTLNFDKDARSHFYRARILNILGDFKRATRFALNGILIGGTLKRDGYILLSSSYKSLTQYDNEKWALVHAINCSSFGENNDLLRQRIVEINRLIGSEADDYIGAMDSISETLRKYNNAA